MDIRLYHWLSAPVRHSGIRAKAVAIAFRLSGAKYIKTANNTPHIPKSMAKSLYGDNMLGRYTHTNITVSKVPNASRQRNIFGLCIAMSKEYIRHIDNENVTKIH